jgi:hypothetical protein
MKQVIAIVNKGNKVPLFTLSDSLAAIVRHELNQNSIKRDGSQDVRFITKRI